MIENQSDNIDNKENDISDQDNVPEDSQLSEDPIIDNDQASSQKTEDINTEDRVKMLRLIENMTLGRNAVAYLTESMHGAGSPQAQRIQISRKVDIEEKKNFAKKLSGIIKREE